MFDLHLSKNTPTLQIAQMALCAACAWLSVSHKRLLSPTLLTFQFSLTAYKKKREERESNIHVLVQMAGHV